MSNPIPRAMRQPLALKLSSAGFLTFWCLLAAFPLFWIAVMSFKVPVDSFAANPLQVIFGPETRAAGKGLSVLDIVAGLILLWFAGRPVDQKPADQRRKQPEDDPGACQDKM